MRDAAARNSDQVGLCVDNLVVVLIAQITDTHIKLPGRLAYRRVGHAEDVRG